MKAAVAELCTVQIWSSCAWIVPLWHFSFSASAIVNGLLRLEIELQSRKERMGLENELPFDLR